ncbi:MULTISPECIES: hypothetical protein [Paenibacillus]|uniref:Uncharacterized protein n=1 Tax=Paenibacillus albilobatus TaxID=2716884 RepID=A0A919XGI4_9BACL|nr:MULTISPECIES: hypothetical protein [Paenibacillus]GIO32417.1 hypothetical protein J2TS6_35580 [Paenibacillus albilobatus]
MAKKKTFMFFSVLALMFTLAASASASDSASSSVEGPKASVQTDVVIVKPQGFIDNINQETTKLQAANDSAPTVTIEEIKPQQKLNAYNLDDISVYGTSRPRDFWNLASSIIWVLIANP